MLWPYLVAQLQHTSRRPQSLVSQTRLGIKRPYSRRLCTLKASCPSRGYIRASAQLNLSTDLDHVFQAHREAFQLAGMAQTARSQRRSKGKSAVFRGNESWYDIPTIWVEEIDVAQARHGPKEWVLWMRRHHSSCSTISTNSKELTYASCSRI